jgi:hypothetical protein
MKTTRITLLLITSILVSSPAQAQKDSKAVPQPCTVRSIFVEDLGNANEATNFRNLLKQQLAKKGFKMVEEASQADAVLTGSISVTKDDKANKASFEQAKLTKKDGTEVWDGNYHETNKKGGMFTFGEGDGPKNIAALVARNIRNKMGKCK